MPDMQQILGELVKYKHNPNEDVRKMRLFSVPLALSGRPPTAWSSVGGDDNYAAASRPPTPLTAGSWFLTSDPML
jgi:hypothetical protein